MLQIGQTVSDGTYQAFHHDQIRSFQLVDYRGQWLVLMFYPGDFSFICPTELQEMGELYPEFQKLGAEVLGISTDSVFVHKALARYLSCHKKYPVPDGGRSYGTAKPRVRNLSGG